MKESYISITVNRNYKNKISDEELADIILKMKEPTDERVFVLFSEVSARRLLKWAMENNIPEEVLFDYYKNYIKPLGLRNPELERVFDDI
jgi:hypothetical protein